MMNTTPLKAALMAEFLGTALLVLLGDGVVASVVLMGKQADWIVITTGWALAVTLGVYLSARLSGGHLNPAVTLALAVRGDFPRERVLPYWLAQVVGAFLGAMLLYVDYTDAFHAFEVKESIQRGAWLEGTMAGPFAGGAGVFCTFPAHGGGDSWRNLFSEAIGTAVLMLGVRAIGDRRNANVPASIQPLLVGAIVWSIGLSLGGLTGYAINPARDFGPRLAASLLGWGTAIFQSHAYYFWVPIVGPLIGGVAGTCLYDWALGPLLMTPANKAEG